MSIAAHKAGLPDVGQSSAPGCQRNEIAEAVGLSIPSISERLHKLEERGVIEGYYAKVNRKSFGFDIMAYITVMMESSKHYKTLITKVEKMPEILECHSVLGEGSHILKAIGRPAL